MAIAQRLLVAALSLLQAISATPTIPHKSKTLNNLTSPYTVTAYVPWNCEYNGLKIEDWDVFQSTVASYCPFLGTPQASDCPNGTDMVLIGSLYPSSLVPGGQDTYVNVDGLVAITVQHEHEIPPGAYWEYEGWTWTGLPVDQPPFLRDCPRNNSMYNCSTPTGYWNFKAPNATVGGVKVCPNEYDNTTTSIYAVTPAFNRTGCVDLMGLGTHPYSGVNPPVWSYY